MLCAGSQEDVRGWPNRIVLVAPHTCGGFGGTGEEDAQRCDVKRPSFRCLPCNSAVVLPSSAGNLLYCDPLQVKG
ncbi:hypothetical protein FKM82_018679 [Ascaphus truei]